MKFITNWVEIVFFRENDEDCASKFYLSWHMMGRDFTKVFEKEKKVKEKYKIQ